MEYLLIFISAIFVNNIVLSQFLGICPFLGVSQKVSTSLGMGAAVAFVLTLATIVTYLVQEYPSAYNHKLCRTWSCHPCHPEGFLSYPECGIRLLHSNRLCSCPDGICRHS